MRSRWIWVLLVQGDAYVARGDNADGMAAYRKAEELAPRDPTVLRRLGIGLSRLRDYTAAIEYFRRSLEARDDQPQVLLELGFAYMQRGDLDSAEAVYRETIARYPRDPGGHANVALLHLRRNNPTAAIEALGSDPEKFQPERWLEADVSPYAYLPFSAGPRMCMGAAFATLLFKIAVSAIWQRFRLEVVPGACINRHANLTLGIEHPLPVRLYAQDGRFTCSPITGNVLEMVQLPTVADERRAA